MALGGWFILPRQAASNASTAVPTSSVGAGTFFDIETLRQDRNRKEAGEDVPGPGNPVPIDKVGLAGHITGESLGPDVAGETVCQWNLEIKVINRTRSSLKFGHDLVLLETDGDTTSLDGVALVKDVARSALPRCLTVQAPFSSYGATDYRVEFSDNTTEDYSNGSPITYAEDTYSGAPSFGELPANSECEFRLVLRRVSTSSGQHGTHLIVALPEMFANDSAPARRFRLIGHFKPTPKGTEWQCSDQEIVYIGTHELIDRLTEPDADRVVRVLAANWLAEEYPKDACEPLVRVASSEKPGPLLVVCIKLLSDLNGEGLEQRALTLLEEKNAPIEIREVAAIYLGTRKDKRALAALVSLARSEDLDVRSAGIAGLGRLRGHEAGAALLALLKEAKHAGWHGQIAERLVDIKDPSLAAPLQELAATGSPQALDVLVRCAFPESYDFFVARFRHETQPERVELFADVLKRMAKRGGGDDHLTRLLLDLLQNPDALSVESREFLSNFLLGQKPTNTLPRLSALAREGNLWAIRLIAGYRDEAARRALEDLAANADPESLAIVLEALAEQWPKQSLKQFQQALTNDDLQIVRLAVQGLGRSGDPAALPLLLPLLETRHATIRAEIIEAIERLPANSHSFDLAQSLLRTDDDDAAQAIVNVLVKSSFDDRAVAVKLQTKLKTTRSPLMRYQIVRLLTHIFHDPDRAESYGQFQEDEPRWIASCLVRSAGQ